MTSGDRPAPVAAKLGAAAYYGLSSMLVQSATKALFTSYGFPSHVAMAAAQMAFTATVMYLVVRPPLSLEIAREALPVSAVYTVNILSGLVGTGGLSVPMFIALRRFTVVVSLVLEYFVYKKTRSRASMAAVLLMVAGSLYAALTDLTFDAFGYAAVMVNNVCSSSFMFMVKYNAASKKLGTNGLLFYNSLMGGVSMLTLLFLNGDLERLRVFPNFSGALFALTFLCANVMGLLVNHSLLVCTKVNDPIATSVVGSFKNMIMTIIGAFAFGDFVYSAYNVIGLSVSMCGAIWYATLGALSKAKADQGKREEGGGGQEMVARPQRDEEAGVGGERDALLSGRDTSAGGEKLTTGAHRGNKGTGGASS
ncbi:unnamed protein product [Pedinophyceae sp. YPF-701]|nr:unnamed protein product [Pedinophyceae sp. YPF-701]